MVLFNVIYNLSCGIMWGYDRPSIISHLRKGEEADVIFRWARRRQRPMHAARSPQFRIDSGAHRRESRAGAVFCLLPLWCCYRQGQINIFCLFVTRRCFKSNNIMRPRYSSNKDTNQPWPIDRIDRRK